MDADSLFGMRGLGVALSIFALLGFSGAVTSSHATPPTAYAPGELLVRFAGSATKAARADALADVDASVVERLSLPGLVRVRVEAGTSVPEAQAAFERRPEVRYAQPNYRYRLAVTPNDPSFGSLWGLHQASDADIDAPEAWDLTQGSDAVTVAVVDSGIDYTHPELQPNVWQNDDPLGGGDNDGNGYVDDVQGWDFANNTNDPADDNGHGTHVAGTIGARGNNSVGVVGVNWRVKLMALKAADAQGFLDEAWIVQAFQYACANGAKVINGSFGGPDGGQPMLDAINACPGSLFVFAAGNDGTNNDFSSAYPCNYPSANVVCVAATNDTDARAGFSNYGLSTVDLAAPGEGILSTVPTFVDASGYDSWQGTSMASPHVAGAAALVLADRPTLTTAELRRALLLGADPRASLSGLLATGARLNVRRSLGMEVAAPAGLTAQSPSPSLNAWTNVNSAVASWGGATDASGVDGYSFGWSADATFSPDEVKDVEEDVTTTSTVLPDGRHWFHVRARDGVGNWSDPVHLGPFQVDTFPPVRPTLSSPTHRARVPSANRVIAVHWAGASDSISGLDGFSFAWSRQPLVAVDQTKDVEETVVKTASARLAPGSWWFGIRSRDNAGNWTDTAVLGPFVVSGVVPVCTVPRLRGLTLVGAKRLLVKRGCKLGRITRTYSRRVRRGRVVAQRPGPGLRRARGTKIAVVLSRGRSKR